MKVFLPSGSSSTVVHDVSSGGYERMSPKASRLLKVR